VSHKILLIDPDPANAALVQQPLLDAGYDITIVTDGNAGLDLFLRMQPDLAVIEADLPDRPGMDLCADIKGTLTGQNVPVIILSNVDDGIDPADLQDKQGCDIVLQKPFMEEELLSSCNRLLTGSGGPAAVDEGALLNEQDLEEAIDHLDSIITIQEIPDNAPTTSTEAELSGDFSRIADDITEPGSAPPQQVEQPEQIEKLESAVESQAPMAQDGADIENHLDSLFAATASPGTPVQQTQPAGTVAESQIESGEVEQQAVQTVAPAAAPVQATSPKPAPKKAGNKQNRSWLLAAAGLLVIVGGSLYFIHPVWLFGTSQPAEVTEAPQQASQAAPAIVETTPPVVEQTPELVPATDEPVVAESSTPTPAERKPEPARETAPVEPLPTETKPAPVEVPVETAKNEPVVAEPPAQPVAEPVVESRKLNVMAGTQPVVESPPSPPAEVVAEPVAAPVAQAYSAAKPLSKIRPAFTPEMLIDRTDDEIILSALIDERGQVLRIKVRKGLAGSPLVNAAIDAILQTTYKPATEGGDPIRSWSTERFTLDD